MRGEILQFDDAAGEGLVSGEDGRRYRLSHRDLIRPTYLTAGQSIDFIPRDGIATDVVVLQTAPTLSVANRYTHQRQGPAELSPWGYFLKCMRMYADANGRARRSEYWWFILFFWLVLLAPTGVGIVLTGVGEETYTDGLSIVGGLFVLIAGVVWLALLLPGICVAIRRFHDVGLSGWLILLNLIPYLGGIITFIITLLPSQPYRNAHGPVPGSSTRETADVFG